MQLPLHYKTEGTCSALDGPARVAGSQKWALILPSSARVSLVTYTAVIAVRYPELDNVQNDLVCFGNYLLGEQATSGGFLPLFWDAPSEGWHLFWPSRPLQVEERAGHAKRNFHAEF